jgi:hypothetical protein
MLRSINTITYGIIAFPQKRVLSWTNRSFCSIIVVAFAALVLPFDSFAEAARTLFAAFFCGLEEVLRRLGEVGGSRFAIAGSKPHRHHQGTNQEKQSNPISR